MGFWEDIVVQFTNLFVNMIFRFFFGLIPELQAVIGSVVWRTGVYPLLRPSTACPNIAAGDGGGHDLLLSRAVEMHEHFWIEIATPIIIVVIVIVSILFLFGHIFDLRKKIRDRMPKFMVASIFAYTSMFWMDVILGLGRALLSVTFPHIPQTLGFAQIGRTLFEAGTGGDVGEGVLVGIGAQFIYFIFMFMLASLVIFVGVSLGVRLGIVFCGIVIMPVVSVLTGLPYLDVIGKKFIKLWIQSVFFPFWMSIPLLLIRGTWGFLAIGFLTLMLGMPFLVSGSSVLAMRAGGLISGGKATQMAIEASNISALKRMGKLGPGMKGKLKEGMASGKLLSSLGKSGNTASEGGKAASGEGKDDSDDDGGSDDEGGSTTQQSSGFFDNLKGFATAAGLTPKYQLSLEEKGDYAFGSKADNIAPYLKEGKANEELRGVFEENGEFVTRDANVEEDRGKWYIKDHGKEYEIMQGSDERVHIIKHDKVGLFGMGAFKLPSEHPFSVSSDYSDPLAHPKNANRPMDHILGSVALNLLGQGAKASSVEKHPQFQYMKEHTKDDPRTYDTDPFKYPSPHRFDLDVSEDEVALEDRGSVPSALKDAFDEKGYDIGDGAEISRGDGKQWKVMEGGEDRYRLIWKEKDGEDEKEEKLEVYDSRAIAAQKADLQGYLRGLGFSKGEAYEKVEKMNPDQRYIEMRAILANNPDLFTVPEGDENYQIGEEWRRSDLSDIDARAMASRRLAEKQERRQMRKSWQKSRFSDVDVYSYHQDRLNKEMRDEWDDSFLSDFYAGSIQEAIIIHNLSSYEKDSKGWQGLALSKVKAADEDDES